MLLLLLLSHHSGLLLTVGMTQYINIILQQLDTYRTFTIIGSCRLLLDVQNNIMLGVTIL